MVGNPIGTPFEACWQYMREEELAVNGYEN